MITSSTLLIFVLIGHCFVAFSFASLLPPVLLSFGPESFRLRPASPLHFLALLGNLQDVHWWVLHLHFFSPIAGRSASPALPRVFLCCWCCSLSRFVQPRVDFDGPCLGLLPLLLGLVPDVRSRSPQPRHFCPEEDLAAR